jgi:hypothetical protein
MDLTISQEATERHIANLRMGAGDCRKEGALTMATYLECAARYFEAITVRLAALESFSPTSDQINALPERLRLFIANIETVADPACLVRDTTVQRDTAEALALRVRELEEQCARQSETMRQLRDTVANSSRNYAALVAEREGGTPFIVERCAELESLLLWLHNSPTGFGPRVQAALRAAGASTGEQVAFWLQLIRENGG